jgi:hypothetical protein
VEENFMSLMLVAVAFASFSAAQTGQVGNPGLSPGASELAQGDRSAPEGSSAPGVSASGERLICRRITVSGTHRYRRVCLTAAQWRQQAD